MCRNTCCSAARPSLSPSSLEHTAPLIFFVAPELPAPASFHGTTLQCAKRFEVLVSVEIKKNLFGRSVAQTWESAIGPGTLSLVDIALISRCAHVLFIKVA